MPERYNFVTENIDNYEKALEVINDLKAIGAILSLIVFERIGGGDGYVISGQSMEVDSNACPLDLRLCLEGLGIAAVFINDPFVTGTINCKK